MLFLNHPLVRGYYLKHGHVYTLRPHRRKAQGPQALVHGSRFKHRPVGKGMVVLAREFHSLEPRQLTRFVRHSGFSKSKDWIEAYKKFNKGVLVLPAYLYEVMKGGNPLV